LPLKFLVKNFLLEKMASRLRGRIVSRDEKDGGGQGDAAISAARARLCIVSNGSSVINV